MTTLVRDFDVLAKSIAGSRAQEIADILYEGCLALEAHFVAFGAAVDITLGVERDCSAFRIVVAWRRGLGPAAEPWDRVFNFTLSRIREIQRIMIGGVGLQIGERMWIELTQFDKLVVDEHRATLPPHPAVPPVTGRVA